MLNTWYYCVSSNKLSIVGFFGWKSFRNTVYQEIDLLNIYDDNYIINAPGYIFTLWDD